MIGETFPDSPEICGAVVSSRKQADRISLWTRNALDEEKAKAAGEHWKRMLGLTNEKIGYQAHSDALRKNSRWAFHLSCWQTRSKSPHALVSLAFQTKICTHCNLHTYDTTKGPHTIPPLGPVRFS